MDQTPNVALDYFTAHKSDFLNDLKTLVRIPSISFPGFDPEPVRHSADAVAELFKQTGLTDVRILETEGHPSVFAQWIGAAHSPTILLYAHHDVQPTGDDSFWSTPAFEPDERDGRLYGRGTSDDKAGVVMYAAAIRSYLETKHGLPLNVKIIIEGEEEIGSTNLQTLLDHNRDLFTADVVLIADSENFDSGIPSLTTSLRGIVTVNVEVKALSSSVHSGTWGGPLPDPVIALSRALAGLVNRQGKPAIPGILDKVRPLSPEQKKALRRLRFSESGFRKQSKLREGVQIIGGKGSVHEKMWYRPSIAVNAIEASSRRQAANIINDRAWARIGIRIVPDMDPYETLELLTNYLTQTIPWGLELKIEPESPSHWWQTEMRGPAFEAAVGALEKGYGRKPAVVGAGGSIPFVQTITEALGGIPALLFGVGDPYSSPHSQNESLLISDWENACRSTIYLFSELPNRLR